MQTVTETRAQQNNPPKPNTTTTKKTPKSCILVAARWTGALENKQWGNKNKNRKLSEINPSATRAI